MINPTFSEKIVNLYKEFLGDRLISIILFGSRARGDANPKSDYDLFIIAEELPLRPFQRLLYIRQPLKGQFDEKLCIIAKTPVEVLNNFPPLFLDLGVDGIVLFDRDDFFRNLQKRIKEIIAQAKLQRRKHGDEFYWVWENPPEKGWEITWEGYREF